MIFQSSTWLFSFSMFIENYLNFDILIFLMIMITSVCFFIIHLFFFDNFKLKIKRVEIPKELKLQ